MVDFDTFDRDLYEEPDDGLLKIPACPCRLLSVNVPVDWGDFGGLETFDRGVEWDCDEELRELRLASPCLPLSLNVFASNEETDEYDVFDRDLEDDLDDEALKLPSSSCLSLSVGTDADRDD